MTMYVQLVNSRAGVSVPDIAAEMTKISKRLDLPVTCNFNSIEMTAFPTSTVRNIVLQYEDDLRFRIAAEKLNKSYE
jgi:hypothetical protein